MARVKSKNTTPEMILRRALWKAGCRYRLKNRLPGKPDVVFPRQNVAIFVDGCFWHGCPEHGAIPKTNTRFWRTKIGNNVKRDRVVNQSLMSIGWTVIRLWEHEIENNLDEVIVRIMDALRNQV